MALEHLWKEGRRVGQVCSMGHRQHGKHFSHDVRWLIQVPRLQRKWVDLQFRGYRPQYVFLPHENSRFNAREEMFKHLFEVTKDPSSHPKCTSFYSTLSALMPSTSSQSRASLPDELFWTLARCSKGLLYVCNHGKV